MLNLYFSKVFRFMNDEGRDELLWIEGDREGVIARLRGVLGWVLDRKNIIV